MGAEQSGPPWDLNSVAELRGWLSDLGLDSSVEVPDEEELLVPGVVEALTLSGRLKFPMNFLALDYEKGTERDVYWVEIKPKGGTDDNRRWNVIGYNEYLVDGEWLPTQSFYLDAVQMTEVDARVKFVQGLME